MQIFDMYDETFRILGVFGIRKRDE